jgi:hypothetical protein
VRLNIKSKEDFLSGLMFIAFGLAAVIIARDYPMGTAMRMGPGYFPTYLGAIMMVMGAIIAARGLAQRAADEATKGFAWRPLIVLSGAFIAFGIAMESLGFIPALLILIMLSALAGKEFRLLEVVLLTAVLIVAAVGIFIYGIELPFRLFWWN